MISGAALKPRLRPLRNRSGHVELMIFYSSSAIYHLKKTFGQDPYTAQAYFYISFSDEEKQTVRSMVKSLIVQVCGCRPDTPQPILDLSRFQTVNHEPGLELLEATLQATTEDFKRIYLVIDGLDECPTTGDERSELLKFIKRIHGWSRPTLHILLTSRREQDIEEALGPLFGTSAGVKVDLERHQREVDRDIGTFIVQKLESPEFNSWPQTTKDNVEKTLTEKAEGMYGISFAKSQTEANKFLRFQYVSLQLEALKPAKTAKAVNQALVDLPVGLDRTYDRALSSLDQNQQIQAIRALNWLAFSLRPLVLGELAEAVVIDTEDESAQIFDEETRLFRPADVLSLLPGLIVVYKANNWLNSDTKVSEFSEDAVDWPQLNDKCIIRLAHFSIKEYLVSDRIKRTPSKMFSINHNNAHIHIARASFVYHLHVSELAPTQLQLQAVHKLFPLWEYATDYCIEHIEAVPRLLWGSSTLTLAL